MSDSQCMCLRCYQFGYFRTETARGGGTIYFDPESMPPEGRNLIAEDKAEAFGRYLEILAARDQKVACLVERRNHGLRVPVEPTYENLLCNSGHFERIRDLTLTARQCGSFVPENPLLPYEAFKLLGQKREIDIVCARIEAGLRKTKLSELRNRIVALDVSQSHQPQKRGKLFESWIEELLQIYRLSPMLDVQNSGEQIDFTFWFASLFYLGEARWHKKRVSEPQVRDFFGKLLDRPPFVVGLLISMSGFTGPALRYISKHSGERTVVTMAPDQLTIALSAEPELPEWLSNELRTRLEHP